MRLSMIVNPFTDENLQLAAQMGVTDVVTVYPGLDPNALLDIKEKVEAQGLKLTALERKIPHLKFVHGLEGRDEQIEDFKTLIRNMAKADMEVLCYNWMPNEDWQRTSCDVLERGGAKVTEFNLAEVENNVTDADGTPDVQTPADQLWENLEYFLKEVVPVAEQEGIKLAIHPDDPPLPNLLGQDRIIISNAAFKRVVDLVPSEVNGICYCCGSLAPAGEDVVAGVKELGKWIHFAHARNVKGTADHFQETWHDTGDIDMFAFIKAFEEVGFKGTIRPDHAPSLVGETNETPGYEMLGRLFASGYLKGLMQAAKG